MEDPIKVIHKYKNNNNRIQYHIHIFLGDIVDENCMRILRKIKNLDLYTSLTTLEEREINILVKNYGDFWYNKFFNSYHVKNTVDLTLANPSRLKELTRIYDKEWIKSHFVNYEKRLMTTNYSYEFKVRRDRERKAIKKVIREQKHKTEKLIDYTTGKTDRFESDTDDTDTNDADSMNSMARFHIRGDQNKPFEIVPIEEFGCDADVNSDGNVMRGGANEDPKLEPGLNPGILALEKVDTGFVDPMNEFVMDPKAPSDATVEFEEEVQEDLEDVDLIFGELDRADTNINKTTKEIKQVISDEAYNKINKKIESFDQSSDNNMFDENLKDVYRKNYITYQYIFKDDNIRTIHNKICGAFKNNAKFGDETYILPAYQYLWSEYVLDGSIEKVMIGKKWIIRNDILKLDVEPNSNLRIYEDLRGNLKKLRDNIRRQGKIKLEDDENNILYDYEEFITTNEIFMIDLFNELGQNFNPNFEELKNLIDVYIKIYFPKVRPDDMRSIITYLDTKSTESQKSPERNKMISLYRTINNDLILENEIMKDIELVKKKNKNFAKMFNENHVTQSVIRTYLLPRYATINLFRIFDNFILSEDYPFVQYQPIDGNPRYRYNEKYLMENEKKEVIMKWFENSPYGISFKLRIRDNSDYKYMAIILSDNGRIDYKVQWKEDDKSTVGDIKKTHKYIVQLVEKINQENARFNIKLKVPTDNDFTFAFINSIQKFQLPNDFNINHNDLSDFSRYFYPYVALVIEPRKRQSKLTDSAKNIRSKFGTYLRYKRISKYENRAKIEHRIIFFMRNYEYNDQSLASEIGKEFNITDEQAMDEIKLVREKYPNIKKSRKVLKKMENIPKYKPPGIGVDIQGKERINYKMRVDGARNKRQLDRIITFMNILVYLYVETYLYKKPERQIMKDKLKRLTRIARRRNKVDEIVNRDSGLKNVKQMTSIDYKRLSYKANPDQNQWTRNCQQSGKDKKRRPQQFLNADDLVHMGYVWNDKLLNYEFGHYEKKVKINDPRNSKKKKEVTLRAVKLPLDDMGENFVYYTCGPDLNGKHMYVGFLGKSTNPYGESMPCCFIKDQLLSNNVEKKNFYLKSIGIALDESAENKISGEQLYILQDSNKIQEGRFAFLPKNLNIYMNHMLGNDREIKNHYLVSTTTGYYFKYGVNQFNFKYLNAIGGIFDLTVDELKDTMIDALIKDKKSTIFNSLNNGNIRAQFVSRENYINYIRNNEHLDYAYLNDLLSTPGVIRPNGINIIIFQKKVRVINRYLEKEKTKETYDVICQNSENINEIKNPDRETVFIIKDHKNYNPIIKVRKEDDDAKEVEITKTFRYEDTPDNIVKHIDKYYKINCESEFAVLVNDNSTGSFNAKETARILKQLDRKEFAPKYQVIDSRFKCIFIITCSGFIVPTIPSGSIYNIPIINSIQKYIKNYDETRKYLLELDKLTESKLKTKPIGVYYSEKKLKTYLVSAIMTESYDTVPIIKKYITFEKIRKEKLLVQNKPDDDFINNQIIQNKYIIDNRIYEVSKTNYESELYQLFRLHLSYYLNFVPAGIKIKEKIEEIIEDKQIDKKSKRIQIKKILYQISSKELTKLFDSVVAKMNKLRGGSNDLVNSTNSIALTGDVEPMDSIGDKEIIHPRSLEIVPDMNQTYENLVGNETTPPTDPDKLLVEDAIPTDSAYNFPKNEPNSIDSTLFPPGEEKWMTVTPLGKPIDYPEFKIKNIRELCYSHSDRNSCGNQYCHWSSARNMCTIKIREDLLIDYINKMADELVQNELKAQEILRKGEYFVSDIVDYNVFTERPGERIIISSNTNLSKILGQIFGKENIPKIGKRRNKVDLIQNYEELNLEHPLKELDDWYYQLIIPNNNTIFRAFANSYFWLTHPFHEDPYRNLGYYSSLQTKLANMYKSQVIDWLVNKNNLPDLKSILPYIKYGKIGEFTIKLSNDTTTSTNCLVELYILSKIYESIIYVNDENFRIIYAFHPTEGFVYDHQLTKKKFNHTVYRTYKKILNLRFDYEANKVAPSRIESLYPKK